MKYILYCHSGSANHGCEALVRTIAAALRPARVVVLSDAPEEDRHYGVDALAELADSRRTPRKTDWISAYLRLKITGDYHHMDAIPYYPALDIIEKEDVAISIGGDVYCYDHYPKYIYINRQVRKRAGKMVLMGCSIEPELLSDPRLVEDLKQFDLITARESITFQAIKAVNPNTVLLPDSAFALPVQPIPLPANWKSEGMVGINLSPLVLRKSGNSAVVMESFRNLIRFILNETTLGVALIPHVVWEDNDDRKPLTALYQAFSHTGRVILADDNSCGALKGIIDCCRFFIGARTHATIAAYSSGVPTLVVGYSVKARGIAKDIFGTEEDFVIPVQSICDDMCLIRSFQEMQKREEDIIRSLRSLISPEEQIRTVLRDL